MTLENMKKKIYALLSIDEKTKDYQWHASFKEKMGLDFSK